MGKILYHKTHPKIGPGYITNDACWHALSAVDFSTMIGENGYFHKIP